MSQKPTPLQAALDLGAQGFAVYPAGNDKRPRMKNWNRAAATAPERIKAMAAQYGFVLIGVATGELSNLTVLDIDHQHDGGEWWQVNRHRLPTTRTHRTRSGGLHLWFRHRPDLRNVPQGKLGKGIEVRGEGGGAIYWPATGLPVLCDAPLAPWPDWLLPPPKPELPPVAEAERERTAAHIEAALRGVIRAVATAGTGARNSTLFWGAARCAEMIARGELSRRHAEAALIEAAARCGLDNGEAFSTIASAFRRAAP